MKWLIERFYGRLKVVNRSVSDGASDSLSLMGTQSGELQFMIIACVAGGGLSLQRSPNIRLDCFRKRKNECIQLCMPIFSVQFIPANGSSHPSNTRPTSFRLDKMQSDDSMLGNQKNQTCKLLETCPMGVVHWIVSNVRSDENDGVENIFEEFHCRWFPVNIVAVESVDAPATWRWSNRSAFRISKSHSKGKKHTDTMHQHDFSHINANRCRTTTQTPAMNRTGLQYSWLSSHACSDSFCDDQHFDCFGQFLFLVECRVFKCWPDEEGTRARTGTTLLLQATSCCPFSVSIMLCECHDVYVSYQFIRQGTHSAAHCSKSFEYKQRE